MGLRDKYAYAIQVCKGKLQGNADEKDGKLYFKGTVASEAEKNEIWNRDQDHSRLAERSGCRYPGECPGAGGRGHERSRRAVVHRASPATRSARLPRNSSATPART